MKPTLVALVFVLLLSVSAAVSLGFNSSASTEPDSSFPQLSMPVEHISYTITDIGGALWAEIDGEYPIYLSRPAALLPLLYPMPPNSTNIHLFLDDRELGWSNYTQTRPEGLHRTAIGNWWMIEAMIENASDSFVLKIHYEHPIEEINGSYVFLYDLNIADYLSTANPTSIAYFSIRFETNVTQVHVYNALPDSYIDQWQNKDFKKIKDGSGETVTVEMISRYSENLPGDLAFVFRDASDYQSGAAGQNEGFPWLVPVALDIVLVSVLLYVKRKRLVSLFSSRETADSAGI